MTADNASNNNTLVDELSELLNKFQGSLTRIRCFAHVLNLVVKVRRIYNLILILCSFLLQAILSQFSHSRKTVDGSSEEVEDDIALKELEDEDGEEHEDDEMEDDDEIDPAVEMSDSVMVDQVAAEADADGSLPPLTRAQITLGRFSLSKVGYCCRYLGCNHLLTIPQIRNLAKRICNSSTIRADLELQCKAVKIKPLLMVRDVSTRWNSTASMLERTLQLREALQVLVVEKEHNRPRGARLARFKLSKDEWDVLTQLFPILDVRSLILRQIDLYVEFSF